VESKTEIQVLQIQWRIGGPQASSGEDTNLVLDQSKPRCIPSKSLSFIFKTLFIILVVAIMRSLCGSPRLCRLSTKWLVPVSKY
jgi:hypothetical protein